MYEILIVFSAALLMLFVATLDCIFTSRFSYWSVFCTFLYNVLGIVEIVIIVPRMVVNPSFMDKCLWAGVLGSTLGALCGIFLSRKMEKNKKIRESKNE